MAMRGVEMTRRPRVSFLHGGGDDDDDEEEERVVYYDPQEATRRPKERERRLSGIGAPKRSVRVEDAGERILERPKELFAQHAAFGGSILDEPIEEGDEEDDEEEDANPFASLLQAARPARKTATPTPALVHREERRPPSSPMARRSSIVERSSVPSVEAASQRSSNSSVYLSAKTSSPPEPVVPRRRSVGGPVVKERITTSSRALAPKIESADSRPARWTRNTTSSGAKRRQSTSTGNAIAMQQADAKRRKSLPASFSSLDDTRERNPRAGRRLSDVLSKATRLSQQSVETTVLLPSAPSERETVHENDDGIADTVHELRDEPFQTQFFSPSKLRNAAPHRRTRTEAVLSKIRGAIGDAIRKATRKTNRDLTLLRSQGQTLLREEGHDSASEVHSRPYVVVRLNRLMTQPHAATYESVVVEASSTGNSTAPPSPGLKLTVVFAIQDGTSPAIQFERGHLVKFYAPFEIVRESLVPGQRRKRRRFLIGTSLHEVITDTNT